MMYHEVLNKRGVQCGIYDGFWELGVALQLHKTLGTNNYLIFLVLHKAFLLDWV